MAAELVVRDATEADMAPVLVIYRKHVLDGTATFEEVSPTLEEMIQRRAGVLALGLPYLVAEREGRILGYSYAGLYRTRSAYRYCIENSVYIDAGLRRQGIGRALMEELIARCENGPWRQMVAIIGDSANQASIGLHGSLGFRMIGTFQSVGFKHGRWLDSVMMQRPLGQGDATLPEG